MKSTRIVLSALFAGALALALVSCSKSTNAVSATNNLDTTPPAAPTNVHGSYDSAAGRDYLNWDASASADVVGYEVWQYSSDPLSGGTGTLIANLGASTSDLALPQVSQAGTAIFRLRAVDGANNLSSFSSTANVSRHAWDGGGAKPQLDPGSDPKGRQNVE